MGDGIMTESDVRFHLVNALSAANVADEQAALTKRTLARYEKERELLAIKLDSEAGESLVDACSRVVAAGKKAAEALAAAETMTKWAERDTRDAKSRLAGVVKERDVTLEEERETAVKEAESWKRERAGLAKAIEMKADECLLTAILRLQRERQEAIDEVTEMKFDLDDHL